MSSTQCTYMRYTINHIFFQLTITMCNFHINQLHIATWHNAQILDFVKNIAFQPIFIYSRVDFANFWCRKMESNFALVLNFWCQKLKTKNIKLMGFNFQCQKLNPKSIMPWVFNFQCQKLKLEKPWFLICNFQPWTLMPHSLNPYFDMFIWFFFVSLMTISLILKFFFIHLV